MPLSFSAGVRDSLSNLAASLGAGRDKAAHDAFGLRTLERVQIEAMYRGDWLARKVVDIVPYDSIRAWRAWSGHRADVARMEAAERRLGLRKAIQRAMTLGRLYGGGAILIGTGETDPAALARPLDERLPRGGLAFLHVVSRWQLGVSALDSDPLSPWVGEPALYELSAPGRPALALHPSRVVRFLGHPLPDPTLSPSFWSDSVLQVLYDAVHAVALTTAGATSLMHEAKVDIVTVPNLSEHLSSTETTQQLSARFAYAAAMKSINNLLLLGDGETWSRQSVDFGGLPEMVRTFLQVAAGAADIPATRLLGQSPAGLSATGDSDTRNYYDMIAARQELDLRPQLERLDRLIARSEGLDPGALSFTFRPLWQLDAPSQAALALSKAQATQIYAGLKLWPDAVTARLVEAQLVADGTYPNAAAVFGEGRTAEVASATGTTDAFPVGVGLSHYNPEQPRDWHGRWAEGGGSTPPLGVGTTGAIAPDGAPKALRRAEKASPALGGIKGFLNALNPIGTAQAQEFDPGEESRRVGEPAEQEPGDALLIQRFAAALQALREVDPNNRSLTSLEPPGYVPTEEAIERIEAATRAARNARVDLDPALHPEADPRSLPELHLPLETPDYLRRALYPEIELGPQGVVITVTGRNAQQRGASYQDGIVAQFGLKSPDDTWKAVRLKPDGIREGQVGEAKYSENFTASIYNPDLNLPFPHGQDERVIQQALSYRRFAPDSALTYYTNDLDLAESLVRRFRFAAIGNFRVVIVPATRG